MIVLPNLARLREQATPPAHGEETWERKMAWDRCNEAGGKLERQTDELARLLEQTAAALAMFEQYGCKPGTSFELRDVGCGICDSCQARRVLAAVRLFDATLVERGETAAEPPEVKA